MDALKRGKDLYDERRFEEAEAVLQETDREKRNAQWHYLVGLCRVRKGDLRGATDPLERVVRDDEHFVRPFQGRMVLSYIYSKLREHRKARDHLEFLLKEGIESVQIYASLGFTYWMMGKKQESLTVLEKALAMDRGNANTLNSIGYILAEQGEDLDRALDLCQKAVAKDPRNGYYLDSLGWIHFRMGDIEKAQDYLKKATRLVPSSETLRKHKEVVDAHAIA